MTTSPRNLPIRCWEVLSCKEQECQAFGNENFACWLAEDSRCFDGSPNLIERIRSRCLSCEVFLSHRKRSFGKRFADGAMLTTMDNLLGEIGDLTARIQALENEARSRMVQVTLLSEVGRALQSTMELDETLRIILTAVTAGDGLGFNRAFLLLLDEEGKELRGRMGVGPAHPAEAESIWKAMETEGLTLREILRQRKMATPDGIMRLATNLRYPLDAKDNIIAACLIEGSSYIASGSHDPRLSDLVRHLGNDHFIVVPLVAEGERLGAIVADNFVTRRPITREDMRLLESFASQAALAIVNASLHGKLKERLSQLEKAHEELSRKHWQLVRAERLVALAGLAATFVHDLKAPIVSMGLMARSALERFKHDAETRSVIEQILEDIVRIEDYLSKLADTATHGRPDHVEIDPAEVIKDSLDLIKGSLLVQNVEAKVEFNHRDAKVKGSPVELRQMMLSLLQNSLEAMPHGGQISISTALENNRLRISVSDTGHGIPQDISDRVFAMFFTTKPTGSGLGLFIVKRIVTDHGGTIALESKEGMGTSFVINLPVATSGDDSATMGEK